MKLLLGLLFSIFVIGCGEDVEHKTSISGIHSWENYHWARTSNPFTLKLRDNVSIFWDGFLNDASYDWNISSVLDTIVVPNTKKGCRTSLGTVTICNAKYGNVGWLGIAQIWISGDHITQGLVKMNDSYFNTSTYNSPEWRRFVMCQEIGHTLGLDHQDEDFNNTPLGSCMDYTNDPILNQHPNTHDYEELEIIYEHLDETTTLASSILGGSNWGELISSNEKSKIHIICNNEECLITHVLEVE